MEHQHEAFQLYNSHLLNLLHWWLMDVYFFFYLLLCFNYLVFSFSFFLLSWATFEEKEAVEDTYIYLRGFMQCRLLFNLALFLLGMASNCSPEKQMARNKHIKMMITQGSPKAKEMTRTWLEYRTLREREIYSLGCEAGKILPEAEAKKTRRKQTQSWWWVGVGEWAVR